MTAMKAVLAEAGRGGGSQFDRDAATVLRRIAEAAVELRSLEPENRRIFLDLLGRVISKTPPDQAESEPAPAGSRLIVP
jgi:hypothetical protein